jgi:nucleoside-diphosphate-sugar epimerase
MRVFVAGASGAIGTRLVPQLVNAGHHVTGTARSRAKAAGLKALGAEPLALDLLDRAAVRKAVLEAHPDAILHEATALTGLKFGRNMDRAFAQTNRLRTEGTDSLLAAAREAGVNRVVAQSFASMRHAREGGMVKTEDDPLDPAPLRGARESSAAMRYLDEAVTDAGGIVLRYGGFYGAANDGLVEPVRKRMFPIVGDGGGVFSWIHLDDAAAATVLALERDGPTIYNIVDDDPAPVREWLPVLAEALGAKPPRRGHDRHGVTRGLQCEGEARARLDAALSDLAGGLRGGLLGRDSYEPDAPGRCPEPVTDVSPMNVSPVARRSDFVAALVRDPAPEDVAERLLVGGRQRGDRRRRLCESSGDLDADAFALVREDKHLDATITLTGLPHDQPVLLEAIGDGGNAGAVATEDLGQVAHRPRTAAQDAQRDQALEGESELLAQRLHPRLVGNHQPVHEAPSLATGIGAARLAGEPVVRPVALRAGGRLLLPGAHGVEIILRIQQLKNPMIWLLCCLADQLLCTSRIEGASDQHDRAIG